MLVEFCTLGSRGKGEVFWGMKRHFQSPQGMRLRWWAECPRPGVVFANLSFIYHIYCPPVHAHVSCLPISMDPFSVYLVEASPYTVPCILSPSPSKALFLHGLCSEHASSVFHPIRLYLSVCQQAIALFTISVCWWFPNLYL